MGPRVGGDTARDPTGVSIATTITTTRDRDPREAIIKGDNGAVTNTAVIPATPEEVDSPNASALGGSRRERGPSQPHH